MDTPSGPGRDSAEAEPQGGSLRLVRHDNRTPPPKAIVQPHVLTLLTTLPAYIWKELIKAVLLATAIFSLILMAVFAGQVMKDGVGVYTLIRVLPNFLPLLCPFVLPLAILTGILICYSRLARDNEIMAAYAGGINPTWLMLPAILTSAIAIFITLTLNEVALLPAIRNIERLVIEDQAAILMRMVRKPGNITVPAGNEFTALSRLDPESSPTGMANLDIIRFAAPGSTESSSSWDPEHPFPTKRITARNHVIHDLIEGEGKSLTLKISIDKPIFQDIHQSDINKTFIATSESGEERLPLASRPSVSIHSNRSSFWPILTLLKSRQDAEAMLSEMENMEDKLSNLPEAQRSSTEEMAARLRRTVNIRTAEINLRLSLCFSCLAFAILGIPLGMRTKGAISGAFLTGIAVAGVFFLALKAGEAQVARGFLPYWSIWTPDVLVVILGVIMLLRNRVKD